MASTSNPRQGSILTLTLTRDNPVNTELLDNEGEVRYTVVTLYESPERARSLTQVCNAAGQTLAALAWHDVRSDRVAFGVDVELGADGVSACALRSGRDFPLSAWLKKSVIPFNTTVTFEDEKKRGYKWKGCGSGESLELYADDTPGSPIAQFKKSHARTQKPAQLLIAPRAQELTDVVVLSLLFLEKSRRARDNSTQNKADGLGTSNWRF